MTAPLVLIADNDADVNELLGEVLRRQGLRVESAADGAQAWARLEAGGVDLLVCDLDMPRLDGRRLLERLAGRPDPPAALVVSGYLDADLEACLGRLPPVRRVFRKPFDVFAFAREAWRQTTGA